MTAVDTPLAALSTDHSHPHPSSLRHSVTNGDMPTPVRENSDTMSTMSSMDNLEARCGGCHKVIDQDNGGIVVAFGYVSIAPRPLSCFVADCFSPAHRCGTSTAFAVQSARTRCLQTQTCSCYPMVAQYVGTAPTRWVISTRSASAGTCSSHLLVLCLQEGHHRRGHHDRR